MSLVFSSVPWSGIFFPTERNRTRSWPQCREPTTNVKLSGSWNKYLRVERRLRPDGLLFKFVDEIFDLIKKGKATAAEKYLFLYEDADGEFGEYMDDQLPKLFLGYPQEVLTLWPIFQKHRKRLAMLQGFTTERERKRIAAKYEGLCKPGDNRCAEVRKVFVPR